MPRYKGGLIAPPGFDASGNTTPGRVDMTPDWMRSLLPDGGKVSLTVHGPPQAAANAPQPAVQATATPAQSPTAFVTGGAVQNPPPPPSTAVAALRTVTPPGAAATTAPAVTAPPVTTPPPNTGSTSDIRGPGPPGPGPGDNTSPGARIKYLKNHWLNPYTGKWEEIQGLDANGNIYDPNKFWAYYSKFPSEDLDTRIRDDITGNSNAFMMQPDYSQIIPNQSGYISQLAAINAKRLQLAVDFGDATLAARLLGRQLTPEEDAKIRNNQNSTVAKRVRALKQSRIRQRAQAAARGAFRSGASEQSLSNLTTEDVRNQQSDEQQFTQDEHDQDQAQIDLFQREKDNYIAAHAGDPHPDDDANRHAYETTHRLLGKAHSTAEGIIKDQPNWKDKKTLQKQIAAIDTFVKTTGKYLDPELLRRVQHARTLARRALEKFLH